MVPPVVTECTTSCICSMQSRAQMPNKTCRKAQQICSLVLGVADSAAAVNKLLERAAVQHDNVQGLGLMCQSDLACVCAGRAMSGTHPTGSLLGGIKGRTSLGFLDSPPTCLFHTKMYLSMALNSRCTILAWIIYHVCELQIVITSLFI